MTSRRGGAVVLDDYFPTRGGGFRIADFSWLLEHDAVDEVMTTATPLDNLVGEYSIGHPQVYRQIQPYDRQRLALFDCAYVLFLNNAVAFLDDLERYDVPFVLTLYPGGGLNLGAADTDDKLTRVFGSPLLRHVITTQPIVTDLAHALARPELPITEILGVTVDPIYLSPGPGFRTDYYGLGKPTLDVAFVAHRYTDDGADKGYPVFLEVIRALREGGRPVRGHVIGGHGLTDRPGHAADLPLTFHGVLSTVELRRALLGMDLMVSPSTPHRLAPGSFDGFPTGSSVEAVLCGVAVFASDALSQNRLFTDRRDLHIPLPSAPAFLERIQDVLGVPDELARLAQAGLRTARRAYGVEAQLGRRQQILESVGAAVKTIDSRSPVPA